MAAPFDLKNVCNALASIGTKWFKIGIQLGIPYNKLEEFKKEDDPLSALVNYCLKGNTAESMSWKSIVTALKSDYVGEPGLAEQIADKYYEKVSDVPTEQAPASTCHDQEKDIKGDSQGDENTMQDDIRPEGEGGSSAAEVSVPILETQDSEMDPKIKMDLEFILEKNLKEIIAKYASYVDYVRECVEEKGITPEKLQSYLLSLSATTQAYKGQQLSLLSDKKKELLETKTITDIFNLLTTECASFLNFDIFQTILSKYKIREDCEELKYHDHLKAYFEKHTIKEFSKINPFLNPKSDSKELTIKCDIKSTCRLAKVVELEKFIAEILDISPSTLQIFDIKDGCIIVTFLLPISIANALFTPSTAFTPQQESAFQEKSVLWLKCNNRMFSFQKRNAEDVKSEIQLEDQTTCSIHENKIIDLYCETCGQGICSKCIMKDEKHYSHKYKEMNKAIELYNNPSLESLEDQLSTIKNALGNLNARRDEISCQQSAIEFDINQSISQLHEILNSRKVELISQLDQLTQMKLKTLDDQKVQLETIQAQLKNYLLVHTSTDKHGEGFLLKSSSMRQIKELIAEVKADTLEPNTEADMIFIALADIASACKNYGQVSLVSSPDPYATGKGLEIAAVGKNSTATLHGRQIVASSIASELISDVTGVHVKCSVESKEQGEHEISYQPTIKGRHQLHIKVEGQHIKGSPFLVHVKAPEALVGDPILTIDGVKQPMGIAINHNGEMVVTEGGKGEGGKGGHCVTVFSSSGKKIRSFGTFSYRDKFLNPNGVAVDREGNVFVADAVGHCIQKFSAHGKLLEEGTIEGGSTFFPVGIAYNASNDKVYTATSKCVHILNSDLSTYSVFNGEGPSNSFRYLACDSSGNLYVGDKHNNSVQVFAAEGEFLREIDLTGKMKYPYGIAIDSNDRVYVSDFSNACTSVFTSEGEFVTSFGYKGRKVGQYSISCLRGLAVDSSGVVYVCDEFSGILLF